MAKKVENLDLEYLLSLIENGNVLNYKRLYTVSVEGKPLESVLKKQYLLKNDTYTIFYFQSFGIKDIKKTKELDKEQFLIYLKREIKNKVEYSEDNYFFDYHKQRVSKKVSNTNLTNEFDIKKLVYEWLLKKDSEAVIIPEFGIGNRRADYISLGSKNTYIIEIKSELDTFDRLEEQLAKYQYIGNYIFMALHISKYKKLIKSDLNIPDNVGILVVENNKLKQIKKANKNNFDKSIFKDYASFEEWSNTFKSFKWASKFHKDQMVKLFEQNISIKNQNDYFYESLKSRHLKESNLRKEAFRNNELEKALGSAKQSGISRLKVYNIYTLKHHSKKLVSENILFDYFTKIVLNFNTVFNGYENIECIVKDSDYVLIMREKFNIRLDSTNELSLYESSLKEQENIKKVWDDFLKYSKAHKKRVIEDIKKTKGIIVLKVGSKKEQENMSELFNENSIKFKIESTNDTYFHLQSYLKENEDCKQFDCILLLARTKSYFHIDREDGICLYNER